MAPFTLPASYCWWTKPCTTKDDDYPIIYRVLTIPCGAGFLSSTVWQAWLMEVWLPVTQKSYLQQTRKNTPPGGMEANQLRIPIKQPVPKQLNIWGLVFEPQKIRPIRHRSPPEVLLMVKSQGQPPEMYQTPVNNEIDFPYQLVIAILLNHQQHDCKT